MVLLRPIWTYPGTYSSQTANGYKYCRPFTLSEQLTSFHAQQSQIMPNSNWVPQSPSQHCTNSSKDTVTHSETANQHPTTKRTHCTKQHATLLAAKRSVVTSDATKTKLHLHNSKYKYKNCRKHTSPQRKTNQKTTISKQSTQIITPNHTQLS